MSHAPLSVEEAHAQRMRSLGEFAANIAHDFNNVLTVLLAQAELARDALSSGDTSLALEELDVLSSSAMGGGDLVRKLLGFSRKQTITPIACAAKDVLARLEPQLRGLVPDGVAVTVRPRGDAQILVDTTLIQQVVLNLVRNSVDAMPRGGTLRLELRTKEIDDELCRSRGWGVPGTYCAISVTDSGTGMSDEVRAKALDPFFTTKRAGEGTGLGLAMAYGVMKQHGGWIDIASRPGKGTRIDLMFPLHEGAEAPALPPPVATRGRGERIVLVEDDDAIREATARLLKRNGYVVRSACDGLEGIELLRHWPEADLVILDLAMPRLGGREMSAALDEARHRIPILFVTGTAGMDEDLEPMLRKPWHAPDLLARVREVLDAAVKSVA